MRMLVGGARLSPRLCCEPSMMRGSCPVDCQISSSSVISSVLVGPLRVRWWFLDFGCSTLQILLRLQWVLLFIVSCSSSRSAMAPLAMMQKPVCVLVIRSLFWCFSRLMFFSLSCFCVGLWLLLTDFECTPKLLPKPFETIMLPTRSLPFRPMFILVERLNSPAGSSVCSRELVGGLQKLLEYFLRSWVTVLGSSSRVVPPCSLLSLRMQLLEESLRMRSSSRMPSKQGCFSASIAESRSAGFIRRSCFMKLMARGEALPRQRLSMESREWISGNFMPRKRWFLRKVSQWSGVSGPRHFWMRNSWSSSFSPGNIGLPSISSPKMQPTAHMSISLPQLAPTSSSGGRYHRVATQSVSSSSALRLLCRAKPKSQILSSFFSLMSRFSGFMSRCSMLSECMQARPLRSWQRRRRMVSGSRPSWDFSRTSRRLFWTYSKTRQTMPFLRKASLSSTMLGCCSILRTLTSRIVVLRTISSSSDSLNFFIATTSLLSLQRHFSTTPYAPSPIIPRMSYFCI